MLFDCKQSGILTMVDSNQHAPETNSSVFCSMDRIEAMTSGLISECAYPHAVIVGLTCIFFLEFRYIHVHNGMIILVCPNQMVQTSTHNPSFEAQLRKIMYTTFSPYKVVSFRVFSALTNAKICDKFISTAS